MKTPMREKYVDEAVGVWMTFGTYPDGNVEVTTAEREIFSGGLPKEKAEAVVAAQKRFRDELYRILCSKKPEPQVFELHHVATALRFSDAAGGELSQEDCRVAVGYVLKTSLGLRAMTDGVALVNLDPALGVLRITYEEHPK